MYRPCRILLCMNNFKPIPSLTSRQIRNFHAKVRRGPLDQCWEWTGDKFAKGYGRVTLHAGSGGKYCAHRIAFVIAGGRDPAEFDVLHRCDNTSCVNPRHLYLGTNDDNIADKMRRGRHKVYFPVGHRGAGAVLSDDQVRELRREYPQIRSLDVVSEKYGISKPTAWKIIAGKTYRNVK